MIGLMMMVVKEREAVVLGGIGVKEVGVVTLNWTC